MTNLNVTYSGGNLMRSDTSRHLKEHERNHQCNACEKQFELKKTLLQDQNTHDRKHICEVCGKEFSQRYDLSRHSTVHNKEHTHKYTIRGNGSTLKSNLLKHNKICKGD